MSVKYEDLVKELREIVRKMEDPDTSLDESIQLYERGAVLISQAEKLLEEAELKISSLGCDPGKG
ncbi:exodeoxyribonuclease VII small subunit [Methanolinea mesophila]|uniref:exodeoxyribonuclease VII small subunit n=1 Tax=Methanolinea mesophila TaxID=547055 RepID=UPI001AEB080E|nr:exodeoxyribonuclease VII small subunit [Methanolinea mesophila]MBP1929704.1 exodeoxyribonuclease VII small subunit [Methanolinea mesophila]